MWPAVKCRANVFFWKTTLEIWRRESSTPAATRHATTAPPPRSRFSQRMPASCTTSRRHSGHVVCERSHMSTHSLWNRCSHAGSRRTASPHCTSSRHTAHSALPPGLPPFPTSSWHSYVNAGGTSVAATPTRWQAHPADAPAASPSRRAPLARSDILVLAPEGKNQPITPKNTMAKQVAAPALSTPAVAATTQKTSSDTQDTTTP
ncbi:hypothetical protein SEVIR_1G017332v4 [Setaria viridis]